MSKEFKYEYGGHEFTMTQEEYDFTERNDLWDALNYMCHEWDIKREPEGWDLMMECYIPFFTNKDTK